jgi:predicted RNA methylase
MNRSGNHTFYSAVRRLFGLLSGVGLINTLSICVSVIEDRYLKCFDRKYGVRTSGYISLATTSFDPAKLHNATRYGPVNAWAFRWILNQLCLSKSLRFADLGCGLGRPCILAAEYGFSKVTGVELASDLCAVARENISIWRSGASPGAPSVSIVQGDVLDYCGQTDDDVFFMFRPFEWEFFCTVLKKLADRAFVGARCITVIYSERMMLPRSFAEAFSHDHRFRKVYEGSKLGQSFYVYECGG